MKQQREDRLCMINKAGMDVCLSFEKHFDTWRAEYIKTIRRNI